MKKMLMSVAVGVCLLATTVMVMVPTVAEAKITCGSLWHEGTLVLLDDAGPGNVFQTYIHPSNGTTFADCGFNGEFCDTYRCFAAAPNCTAAVEGRCYLYLVAQCQDPPTLYEPTVRALIELDDEPCQQ